MMTENETANKIAIALLETNEYDICVSEMTELAKTAGFEVALIYSQKRSSQDHSTYFGSGKVKEIKKSLKANNIDTIIFADELSPIQHANLTDELDVEVLDRTNLILKIFSLRARTAEGKIQVELARLKYLLPRLRITPGELSRQGAGVLARGPGETKLEMDKRYLKERIRKLKEDLTEIEKQRAVTRENRENSRLPLIALVGYTNAGKSTLFNRLTESDVLAENKLFATLDTTIRRTDIAPNLEVLFSDTVGFIRKLPHHLVESFKSTLEEITFADIVLNVCDASDPQVDEHINVTRAQLENLKITAKIFDVYNKCDLLDGKFVIPKSESAIGISAIGGQGIDTLKDMLIKEIQNKYTFVRLLLPYSKISELSQLQTISYDTKLEYIENGLVISGYFLTAYYGKYGKYIKKD
ncbi:MAG TPA: GTPase HflX [Clostridia bacterium]|nr:GTPase HflX [Clostridia bacterium]